jgi:hypothetical protein
VTKPVVAANLTWAQVHGFRLERHYLARRAPRRALGQVVGAIGGVQAQVMSGAELQIAVRVNCSVRDVRKALWVDKALVKTWLMRGTLHLVPAGDLPLFAAATGWGWHFRPSWLKFFGTTEAELTKLVDTIGDALSASPMTREDIIAIAGAGQSPRVREFLRSGWGSFLKPVARRGLLCFGPSRGTSVTFVRPEKWLGSWRDVDADTALLEVARRYLGAYGPATKSDFARWFGPSWPGVARAAWAGLASELAPVSIEGERADILAADLPALRKVKTGASVALLPGFDPYLMGHESRDHLFDRHHAPKVSRIAGWISAVVLVDGRVEGTWTHRASDGKLQIRVERFEAMPRRVRAGIAERAEAVADALGLHDAAITFS